MDYTIQAGTRAGALEAYFQTKPSEEIREALKSLKMRWNGAKKCWWGFTDEQTLRQAIDTPEATPEAQAKPTKAQAINKYGIKVGDVFHMSWGYEQTNNDFFQVVEIVGACMVRVKAVIPPIIEEKAICSMSCDRVIATPDGTMWKTEKNIFIQDNEKGDLKKVQQYVWNGQAGGIYITIDGHHASKFLGGKVYESWYY